MTPRDNTLIYRRSLPHKSTWDQKKLALNGRHESLKAASETLAVTVSAGYARNQDEHHRCWDSKESQVRLRQELLWEATLLPVRHSQHVIGERRFGTDMPL